MLLTTLYGWANGKEAKHFCFRDTNSASSRYVAWVRKRGNIRETFKVSVSSVFPKWFLVCSPTQHMLKTQNLRHGSKKCFWNFPKTFFCVLDAFLLPQQCFLVCAYLYKAKIHRTASNDFTESLSSIWSQSDVKSRSYFTFLQLKSTKGHGKNDTKIKPSLVRHLLRNCLFCVCIWSLTLNCANLLNYTSEVILSPQRTFFSWRLVSEEFIGKGCMLKILSFSV